MLQSIPWDGKKITKPGMYSGIPNELYHGDICDGPSVSTTGLKRLLKSPRHYWSKSYLNPEAPPQDETSALIFGRAIHHLILGEPNFQMHYAEQPEKYEDEETGELKKWNNNANACKRWNVLRANEGRYVLTKSEVENIRGTATAIHSDDPVHQDLLTGLVERSIFWKDKKTGIWLKLRPDVIPISQADGVDLKTAASIEWDDLQRAIFTYGYYQQGAMYREGFREVLDVNMEAFTLFFVESNEPFCPRPVIVKDIDLEIGAIANRAALDLMAASLKSGIWPGPRSLVGHAVEHIEMSAYHKNRICTQLALMGYQTPDYEGKR